MTDKTISLQLADVVKILEQISPLVVSLDRIGSQFHDDRPGEAEVVNQFSLEFDLAGRLALVRGMISRSLDEQLDRVELIEIEEKLEGLPCWGDR